jgi:hypothetical protein
MNELQLTVGLSPPRYAGRDHRADVQRWLTSLTPYRAHIRDVHFAHYNPMVVASGRMPHSFLSLDEAAQLQFHTIQWNQQHTGFRLTLLLNYLLHDHYRLIVDDFARNYYSRGVRSVVVADLNLIKALRDRFPDLLIQGSCLSYRMTEGELAEEARAGVSIHNPAVDIIRNSAQLRRNHAAGFRQKVIFAEGCLHECPAERPKFGHRWHIARGFAYAPPCEQWVTQDPRRFLRANWVTIARLKELAPYIDCVKLPRGSAGTSPESPGIGGFIELYRTGRTYNVLDYLAAFYREPLRRMVGYIPSSFFDTEFFQTIEACGGQCRERGCRLCYGIIARLQRSIYTYRRQLQRGPLWQKATLQGWSSRSWVGTGRGAGSNACPGSALSRGSSPSYTLAAGTSAISTA